MATTFDVIFLGVSATDIDPIEGNATSEGVGGLVGSTFGSLDSPLFSAVGTWSPVGLPGLQYDVDNIFMNDRFSVDGTTFTMDGWGVYTATLTYVDGTTDTVEVKIAQATTGDLFLTPHLPGDADKQAVLEALPLLSLRLDSLGTQGMGMWADRIESNYSDPVDGTSGDDVMSDGYVDGDGTAITGGPDLIHGGDGNDNINAGFGDDTIFGGAGNDTIDDWDGDDLVFAGDGDDVADVSRGNDTFHMGAGNDLVNVWDNDGVNAFFGGTGIDTLQFQNWQTSDGATATFDSDGSGSFSHFSGATSGTFAEFEQISGTDYGDTLNAAATTTGVTLAGQAGDDSLVGGAGNDTLDGGSGNDTLAGGAGDDLIITGGGRNVIVLRDGGGDDVVTGFNMMRMDGSTVDRLDVTGLTNGVGGPVTWRDVTVSDTNGDGTGDAILTFPGGESVLLEGVLPDQVDSMEELVALGIPCFAGGTPVLTPTGARPVETLVRGDLVVTTTGPAPVLWAGSRGLDRTALAAAPALRPIHFAPGSIGNTRPLRLSPQHAVQMAGPGGLPVLVRAKHLAEAGLPGVRIARGVRTVVYHHLLLDRHRILSAADAPVESLYPGPQALASLPPSARLALARALIWSRRGVYPARVTPGDLSALYGPRALPLLGRQQALRLCRARTLRPPPAESAPCAELCRSA